ncbi:MAG: preprotein translocase subunit YajC [Lutibacter sp.]|jgi:preprotein translocase subunit YajC|uniref:preprotein translocase subunit YajC n=1 Tax=Lutibacter sp. TaxID=1925666 RepID=UPI00299D3FD4|nr:preprotein translocase subunit YajC [Lutibacter sp.]MDX1828313.1 preprotein translocase subunit YajC [Lutibacter sp.]
MYNTIFLQAAGGSSLTSMLPFLLMFVVIYFFMIRPQMKRQKNEKKFQSALAKGNKVITTSGIHGKIVDIVDSDNTVIVETGAGKIKFERSSISMELSKRYLAPKDKK